jgi:hypothetical protein
MKKILMILYKFPPSNDVGAFRPIKFINHLNKFGWNPIVLAPSNGVYFSNDPDLENSIENKCKIFRVPMFFPFKKLDLLKPTKFQAVKHLLWRIWNRLALPDGVIAWIFSAIPAGIEIARMKNIDIIFASGQPFSSFIIASVISRITGKRLILDYRDTWTLNPFYKGSLYRSDFERQLEKYVLRSASAAIFTSDEYRKHQTESFGILNSRCEYYTITNSFEGTTAEINNFQPQNDFIVIHAGNLYGSPDPEVISRDPKVFFLGLSIAASLNKKFAATSKFIFYGVFNSKKLEKICSVLGISSMVSFKARIPQSQLLPAMRQASVLLLINFCGPGHHVFIPAKFFDYLKVGRPILCLSESGALTQIINKTDSGVVVDPKNPVKVARELLHLYDQIHLRKTPFFVDQKKIVEYESYQTTKYLADICDKVISGYYPNGY